MLLRELTIGQRFIFEDRKTPLALTVARGQYPSKGTFRYEKVGEHSRPILWHIENDTTVEVVYATYYRSVLVIL